MKNKLLIALALLAAHASIHPAEETSTFTLINETDKNYPLVLSYARFYAQERPIQEKITSNSNSKIVIPMAKGRTPGSAKIYALKEIFVRQGDATLARFEIDPIADALLAQGAAHIALERNPATGVSNLVLALTDVGQKQYEAASDKGKKKYQDLGIRVKTSSLERKKEAAKNTPPGGAPF